MKRTLATILPCLLFTLLLQGDEKATLDNAIHDAAAYLLEQVRDNGSFVYRINMNPEIPVQPKYNMLRHAGTVYSLTMYQARFPDPATLEALHQSVAFLRKKAIGPVEGPDDDKLAVWTDPKITNSGKPPQAKLGGAGLALVALINYEAVAPGSTDIDELRALARFIVFMQKPDGGFYSKYIPSAGGRDDSWTSLFYPGEAALGLAMLHEIDPDPLWLETAIRALEFLARSREGKRTVEADHWALLATAQVLKGGSVNPETRERLIAHAVQVCQRMLDDQVTDSLNERLRGGFADDGRTTPSSTRLEGLHAALEFIPDSHPMHARILSTIPDGVDFLLRAQITSTPYTGAFSRGVIYVKSFTFDPTQFNQRVTEIRIDYVQHALSALLQHRDLLQAQR